MSKKSELVSISECARLLMADGDEVKRAALNEYCNKHGLKQKGKGKRPVVDFEAVKRHRQQNGMRSIMSGKGLDQKSQPEVPRLPTLEERRQDPTFRKKEAEAELSAIELEEKKNRIVAKHEVEAGIADMFATYRAAEAAVLGEAVNDLVSELKLGAEGRKLIKRALKEFSRELQSAFHNRAGEIVAKLNQDENGNHRDRLMQLATLAYRMQLQPDRSIVIEMATA